MLFCRNRKALILSACFPEKRKKRYIHHTLTKVPDCVTGVALSFQSMFENFIIDEGTWRLRWHNTFRFYYTLSSNKYLGAFYLWRYIQNLFIEWFITLFPRYTVKIQYVLFSEASLSRVCHIIFGPRCGQSIYLTRILFVWASAKFYSKDWSLFSKYISVNFFHIFLKSLNNLRTWL